MKQFYFWVLELCSRYCKVIDTFQIENIGVSKTGKQKEGFNQTYEINELDELLGGYNN